MSPGYSFIISSKGQGHRVTKCKSMLIIFIHDQIQMIEHVKVLNYILTKVDTMLIQMSFDA